MIAWLADREVDGVVEHGDERGRLLGFPTANLDAARCQGLPSDGVYAGVVVISDGRCWPAAINVGTRPTVGGRQRLVEAHLIDFDGDLYGSTIRIRFLARIRDERRFGSLDALVQQLRADVMQASVLCAQANLAGRDAG